MTRSQCALCSPSYLCIAHSLVNVPSLRRLPGGSGGVFLGDARFLPACRRVKSELKKLIRSRARVAGGKSCSSAPGGRGSTGRRVHDAGSETISPSAEVSRGSNSRLQKSVTLCPDLSSSGSLMRDYLLQRIKVLAKSFRNCRRRFRRSLQI